jgi:hypothetical protein
MMRRLLLTMCLWAGSLLRCFSDLSPLEPPPAEPGPENGGLRLRFSAKPDPGAGTKGYHVRIDVLNVSARDVLLRANWDYDEAEGVSDYLNAATSIECVPAVAPWIGGVMQGHRKEPQPEQVLKAGEKLSVSWITDRARLKNRVTNPNEVQNPTFPFSGLYSVHATLNVVTSDGTFALRSNEQLVPVDGNRSMPRFTMGQLSSVDGENKTATLGLGSLQQVSVGDEFEIGNSKGMHWKLTIARVEPGWSFGNLELLTKSKHPPYSNTPTQGMSAVLVVPK